MIQIEPVNEPASAEFLKLGTPDAALRSVVNLLSRLFEQPEEYVACYLDLYYFVRQEAERRKAETQPPYLTRADAEKLLMELIGRKLGASEAKQLTETLLTQEGRERNLNAFSVAAAPLSAAGPEQPPDVDRPEKKPGVNANKAAAEEKRRIIARLEKARADGVTTNQIVNIANGAITSDQIYMILARERLPIAVYRVLDASLDQLDAG